MSRLPALALALALMVAATTIVATIGLLPPVVPSHFGLGGRPDRWSPRDVYVVVMLAMAVGLPLMIAGSMRSLRTMPPRWINLPHRDYWLAAERRDGTYATLRAFGCSVGAWLALFMTGVHLFIVTGTMTRGASMNPAFFVMLAVFLAGMALMLLWLVRRFARPG
jgi:uncharacterized membrane protein